MKMQEKRNMAIRAKQKLVVSIGLALGSTALAVEVELPYQFQAGTPVIAEEVNQNFSALAENVALLSEALLELESKLENGSGGLSVYVDDVRVGAFLGPETKRGGAFVPTPEPHDPKFLVYIESDSLATARAVEVRSDKGYLFRVATDPLFPQGIQIPTPFYFRNADCSGTPHLNVRAPTEAIQGYSSINPWVTNQGIVLGAPPGYPAAAYYVPAGAPVLEHVVSTFMHLPDPLGCSPVDVPVNLVELMPNDPTVTGVPDELSGRVTIGR